METSTSRRRVAVVGSGVAGITAAYILQREADVTLYEAADRLGGHAHTHELETSDGHPISVDTGFIVHNDRTYPHLLRLFAELDVATQESDMSMSVRCDGCGLEYAGARGVRGILAGRRTLANPAYLRMLGEVVRFHRAARALLARPDDDVETLESFVTRNHFSGYFRSHFLTPVISAVWSSPAHLALEYPARYLFSFLANHGMLSITGSPTWRTVSGGSARYIERAAKSLTAVQTSTPVRKISRVSDGQSSGVTIRDDSDQLAFFDAVVIATHPHQALTMLESPSSLQTSVLSAMPYSVNPTVLHSDESVLPRTSNARASWNYRIPGCDAAPEKVFVSYDMNRLQRLDTTDRYLVSLNATGVDPSKIIAEMVYEHPIYTPESVAAQRLLPEISDDVIAFAGAYHGWGFHEDGCRSGVEAAARLGVSW
jgi:predicted NAD/FAD-binding protein